MYGAECDQYKEERNVLDGEIWELNGDGMESFDRVDGRGKNDALTSRYMVATDGKAGRE